uniref:Homeobox domain-containing protein n=1 Tax=Setaria digitata TaxID=48799 RepID=A0A915Q7X9_9BILA
MTRRTDRRQGTTQRITRSCLYRYVIRKLKAEGTTRCTLSTSALMQIASRVTASSHFSLRCEVNDWGRIGEDFLTYQLINGCPYITRFNHLLEIPKLERWFRTDPNPSRQKLINYMNVLNGSSYRRHNVKVTYQQICNWFANQRAANRVFLEVILVESFEIEVHAIKKHSVKQGLVPGEFFCPDCLHLLANKRRTYKKSPQTNHTNVAHCPSSVVQSSILLPSQSHSSPSGEFRPKFDFNSLLDSKQANGSSSERIEGGSESPTPNDDVSVHSTSDCGFDQVSTLKQDSATSSPEISFDLNGGHASTSPKPAGAETLGHQHSTSNGSGNGNGTAGQAPQTQTPSSTVARSRLMFDPLTELPVLEKWFEENPHPTWLQIDHYTEALNSCQYRQSYPPISTHNVKIWFKNRRAKCKRMQTGDLNLKMMI